MSAILVSRREISWSGTQLGRIGLIIGSERFRAFAEDRKVVAVAEHATAPAAGHLLDNSEVFKVG
jgi:hypothetical protein